jgi:hypothetical protein
MQFRKIGSTDSADMYFSRKDNNYLLAFVLLILLAFYSAAGTFSFGKLFYLTIILYFALVIKRLSGGSFWFWLFSLCGLTGVVITSLCSDAQSSFAAAGMAGLLGALDVLRRRCETINKGHNPPIWNVDFNLSIFALAAFAAMVLFNAKDEGTELCLVFGTLAGYGLGNLAPVAGRTKLHYSKGCVLHVVSRDWAITGVEQTGTLRIDHFEDCGDILFAETSHYNRKNEKVVAFAVLHGNTAENLQDLAQNKELNILDLQG